jgi:hypothetical protein
MKRIAIFAVLILSLLIPVTSQGQKPVGKTPAAKAPVAKFSCPDDKATVACNSFAENKDRLTDNMFVCFREGADQYFTVAVYLSDDPGRSLSSPGLLRSSAPLKNRNILSRFLRSLGLSTSLLESGDSDVGRHQRTSISLRTEYLSHLRQFFRICKVVRSLPAFGLA